MLRYGTWVTTCGPRTQRCGGWAEVEGLAVWGRRETPGLSEDILWTQEE